jgi:hypothetical protein
MSARDPRATPASHFRVSAMLILVVRLIENKKARRSGILWWYKNHKNFLQIWEYNLFFRKDFIFSRKCRWCGDVNSEKYVYLKPKYDFICYSCNVAV